MAAAAPSKSEGYSSVSAGQAGNEVAIDTNLY